MWTCPECDRNFKNTNQSHMCTNTTIDDIFADKPAELLLAFDKLLVGVIDWEPSSVGTSTKAVIFTKEKAWLIVKPMAKALDIKFYYPTLINHKLIKKTNDYGGKIAHHIRIKNDIEVNNDLLNLLYKAYKES